FQVVQALRHAAQIARAAAGGVLETLWVNLIDDAVLPPVRKGIHSTFLQMRRGATAPRKRELNNLQRALTELTLVNHSSQRHWDDNRHRHRQRKYLPERGLNGEDTRQAADANPVRHHAVQAAQQARQTGADHRAEHREAVFQVDTVHRRFSDAVVSGDGSRNGDLSLVVLTADDDDAGYRRGLRNVRQGDDRPDR